MVAPSVNMANIASSPVLSNNITISVVVLILIDPYLGFESLVRIYLKLDFYFFCRLELVCVLNRRAELVCAPLDKSHHLNIRTTLKGLDRLF